MRCYASGEIELSKEIPASVIEKVDGCGWIDNGQVYMLDHEEYFVDEVEDTINALCNYAKENGIELNGEIEMEIYCDSCKGVYVFSGTEYEEFWGNQYYLRYMDDGALITELESRGYKVEKEVVK